MEVKKFAVIGGDKRNVALQKMLAADGHEVKVYGFMDYQEEEIKQCNNLYETLEGVNYVVGPTPCSHDSINLNAVYINEKIMLDDIFRLMKSNQHFFAGHIKRQVLQLAERYEVNVADILKREELALLNAIPTSEGAIQIAIEETDITLHGSNVMVIGYGRIGKILSKMLGGIGAHVFTVVNKIEDYAQSRSYSNNPIMYADMNSALSEMDVIFNTVPKIVLDRSNLKYVKKTCLIIDVSSEPYGVDHKSCKDLNIKVLYTNSLPGRVAPVTAASYIKETIYNIIKDMEADI